MNSKLYWYPNFLLNNSYLIRWSKQFGNEFLWSVHKILKSKLFNQYNLNLLLGGGCYCSLIYLQLSYLCKSVQTNHSLFMKSPPNKFLFLILEGCDKIFLLLLFFYFRNLKKSTKKWMYCYGQYFRCWPRQILSLKDQEYINI